MKDRQGGRIEVYVDGETRTLFLGMRVRHAIGAAQVKHVESREAVVVDGDGYRVDLDGAVYDEQQLRVVRTGFRSDADEPPE